MLKTLFYDIYYFVSDRIIDKLLMSSIVNIKSSLFSKYDVLILSYLSSISELKNYFRAGMSLLFNG